MIWNIPDIEQLKQRSFKELLDPEIQKKLNNGKRPYRIAKRFIDIVFSAAALVIFAPAWLLLMLLIRIDSKGGSIFSHERVGRDGKIFRLYKFRTMREGVRDQEFAPDSLRDPRITRIGRFLRRTSLDEVPQFWNVLKGDMSLVGPRPEMEFIVKKYDDLQKKRLIVKPGLTGLWQILGRKDLPLRENVEYDFYYILHRSLLLDLLILLKTVSVVVSGKGAY